MAVVAEHLSVVELEERYKACKDVTSSRHFQAIVLLAKGHSTSQAAQVTSFGQRWIEQLLERYNAIGPATLGDLRKDKRPSEDFEAGVAGAAARAARRAAARRRTVDKRQSRALDG